MHVSVQPAPAPRPVPVPGTVQWGTAGVAAPIAGLGGTGTAVPVALMVAGGALVSTVGLVVAAAAAEHRPRSGSRPLRTGSAAGPPARSPTASR